MKKIFFLFILFFILFAPTAMAADEIYKNTCEQTSDCKMKDFICDPETKRCVLPVANFLQTADPNVVIGRVIKYIIGLSGTLALVMFMFGGMQWITSAGNPEKIKKGQNYMLWSAIGLIFTLTAYIFVNFVLKLFGQ